MQQFRMIGNGSESSDSGITNDIIEDGGIIFAILVERKNIIMLKYILTEDFIDVWSWTQIKFLIRILIERELTDGLVEFLKSKVASVIVNSLSHKERY